MNRPSSSWTGSASGVPGVGRADGAAIQQRHERQAMVSCRRSTSSGGERFGEDAVKAAVRQRAGSSFPGRRSIFSMSMTWVSSPWTIFRAYSSSTTLFPSVCLRSFR